MALVSKSIPNLINGVSQQPAALRLESQGEVQENGFSDVVDGLKKRPPTKFLKQLKCLSGVSSTTNTNLNDRWDYVNLSGLETAFFHTYKRSDDEQYHVIITSLKKVHVYDIAGNLRYQSGHGSWLANGNAIANAGNTDNIAATAYLPTTPSDITSTSVADATFIVNKDKVVSEPSSPVGLLSHNERSALIYLKSVNYGRSYTVRINGTGTSLANSVYTTPKQITEIATDDDQTINSDQLKTGTVIGNLRNFTTAGTGSITKDPSIGVGEPYFIVEADSTFGDFSIKVTDDDGGVNLKAFKGTAKSFTDLPNQCENGYILGVVGDNQKKEDDFHVKFEGTGGSGFWRECAAPNINHGFALSTMPHQLKQNADLSFTFGQPAWNNRVCGDENTNPFPSFVGSKITDIFFHRNRLGVLAGENVIFSEASGYYNFFRTTVRTLLDSDPIDVAVSQNEVSELKAAVPIQDNLLLFSTLNQFTLSASQLLTPAEVTVDQSTKYECDLTAPPVGAGNSVFFATKSGGYAGVREFFTRETTEVRDATSITSHVPTYLEGNIRQFDSSANEDMLACLTSSNKKECYIYKWYNSSEERLQSSWSKWIFTEDIAHIYFTNNLMYFTFEDGSYEVVDVKYDHTEVLLDRQITVTRDNWSDQLDIPFTAPYASGYTMGNVLSYTAIDESGIARDLLYNTASKVFFHNAATQTTYDATANGKTLIIGVPYTFKYQMSEQVFKPKQGDSTQLARFQLKKLSFNYNDTGHFDVTVDSVGRSPITSHFTGRVLDNQHNLLDQAAIIDDGSFQVGVQAQATKTAITITNDSHLPSTFQSAEWEGYVVLRNQRL